MRGVSRRRAFRGEFSAKTELVCLLDANPLSSSLLQLGSAPQGVVRTDAKMCDSPKIKTGTPTKKKPEEEDEEEQKPPLTPSQRKRSEEEIILSAPASAQSAKSKESPEKEPKSKKQKRQSEKLKCISSPKPIGI